MYSINSKKSIVVFHFIKSKCFLFQSLSLYNVVCIYINIFLYIKYCREYINYYLFYCKSKTKFESIILVYRLTTCCNP